MKLNRFLLVLGLTAIGLTTASKKANALTWTIGTNSGMSTSVNYYHGQSFTPNVSGPSGLGTPGATVSLQSFTFGSSSSGNLYIYSNQYSGTPSGLSSGSGLIGVSSMAVNGTYNFGNGGLLLSSVSSPFYAYTDSSISSLVGSNSYSGGSAYFTSNSSSIFANSSTLDWNFSATFTDTPTQAVPWNIEPRLGVALGLPLFIGLRMLKKRRALKNSSRKVHDLTSVR
ncbi:hypothetical protein [Nostoc sp.]|uniref:hypothetical protein n=1 Tax=Nostoc sp. TaxID=1180 RepID=UPI002FF61E8F